MGLTKQELKSLVKEVVQDLITDKDFLDIIIKKMSDKIDGLEKNLKTKNEEIATLDAKFKNISVQYDTKFQQIDEILNKKDQKICNLENAIERMQQNEKLRSLCIYGLDTAGDTNLSVKVKNIINEYIKVEVNDSDIFSCYRIGKQASRSQPVIVKFESHFKRNCILAKCRNLKGTRLGICEDLTKQRLALYKKAQEAFSRKSVFTRNGNVFVKIGDTRQKIVCESDIQKLEF